MTWQRVGDPVTQSYESAGLGNRSQAPSDLGPKTVVYLSWYKQRKTVLFFSK